MDKRGRRFIDENEEKSKIIDLSEANVTEEWDASEDIDTMYEKNEGPVREPTKVINISYVSDKKQQTSGASSERDAKSSKKSDKEKQKEERLKEKNAKKLEKLKKKQQRQAKKSGGAAPVEEETPAETSAPSSGRKKRRLSKKKIIALVLVLVIVFGVVFVFSNSDRLSWHNIRNYVKYGILNQKSEEHFPISIHGENVDLGNFQLMGQDICFASDTKMQIINNYGRCEYTTQHGFNNPVLRSCKTYDLIFSLGGNGYQLNSYEKTIHAGKTDERLVAADIIDNGTYALITTSNGYLSKMTVYDKENKKIYGYSFADYYVTSVSLAPNGKGAVVSAVSALNGSEVSALYVLDFTKDKPAYLEEVEDNIFYEVKYLNDTYACAVGNDAVSSINTKNGKIKTTDYDSRHLTCYAINDDTDSFSISLSRSGDGRNCEIFSFQGDGALDHSFETDYTVKYISTFKGRVALLTPDVIYLYAKDGNKVSEKKVDNEPRALVMYTSGDAYVLDTNEISSLTI